MLLQRLQSSRTDSPAVLWIPAGEDQPGAGFYTLRISLVTHPRSLKARRAPLRLVSLLLICHRVRLASMAEMHSRH